MPPKGKGSKAVEVKDSTKATPAQKAAIHGPFDLAHKAIFASKDEREQIRSIEYRLLSAMFYGEYLNPDPKTRTDEARFNMDGILDPRKGEAHIAKLHPDYHDQVRGFVRYTLFERSKRNTTKLTVLFQTWNTQLNYEIDKLSPNLTEKEREDKIREILTSEKLKPSKLVQQIRQRVGFSAFAALQRDEYEEETKEETKAESEEEREEAELENLKEAEDSLVEASFADIIGNDQAEELYKAAELKLSPQPESKKPKKERKTLSADNNIRNLIYCKTATFYQRKFPDKLQAYMEKKFAEGVPAAQNNLGVNFFEGTKVKVDYKKAFELFQLAANQGLAHAQFNLGVMHKEGRGTAQNSQEAIRLIRLAAAQGHASAQCYLGVLYEKGEYIEKNLEKAIELYKLSAAQGLDEAQYNLGLVYIHQGNCEAAIELYKLAASQGLAEAQSSLGKEYYVGENITQDLPEALKLFQLAADQKFAEAQFNLAVMHYLGNGVPKNIPEAFRLRKLAADQGLPSAQYVAGVMLFSGEGTEKNEAEGIRYIKLAAQQNFAEAQLKLGIMYGEGIGVTKDEAEACRLYKLAADQGLPLAQCNLGAMLVHGRGIDKNVIEGLRLYELAASKGDMHSQLNAGKTHEYGYQGKTKEESVVKDRAKAFDYYQQAALQGYAEAQFIVGRFFIEGTDNIPPQNFAEALRYSKLAADQNHKGAQCNIGIMYYRAIGVEKNNYEALRYHALSAEQGHLGALKEKELVLTEIATQKITKIEEFNSAIKALDALISDPKSLKLLHNQCRDYVSDYIKSGKKVTDIKEELSKLKETQKILDSEMQKDAPSQTLKPQDVSNIKPVENKSKTKQ